VPSPPGCTCLGLEQHDYDFAELRVKDAKGVHNATEFGNRWTCHYDCKLPIESWGAQLQEQGWEIFETGRDHLNAQKGARFLKCTGALTVLQRAGLRDFSLPAPGDGDSWFAPLPGSTLASRQVVERGNFEVTNKSTGITYVHAPFVRLRFNGPFSLSGVEVEALYERALAQSGWDILSSGRGGVLIAHYAKGGRDLWAKVTPGRDYEVLLGDVGAQEAQARLAEELAARGHVALYGIYFDTASPQLKPESEAALQKVRALLEAAPALRVEIQGHTDNTGRNPGNQLLSEARAKSVTEWLAAHGIAEARLAAKGYADTKPVADNGTPEGRALNRRVEVAKQP
jgi:outer membrane protein OmpA-like peptidoglycan-associated protein